MLVALVVMLSVVLMANAAPVKIMSFNIDCRFCDMKHENGDSWNQRVKNEKDTFARYDPDLMGIEEPMFPADVEQLLPKGYKALYNNNATWLPWGAYPDATIFYKEDRFVPQDFHWFWLGPNPNFPAGFDRLALPRLAVYALFLDKQDNSMFYFGATHFDHGDDLEGKNVDCVESAKELIKFTAPLAEKYPFVWVGDFNSRTNNNNAYSILTNSSAPFYLDDSYFNSPTHTVAANQTPPPAYDYGDSIDHIFMAHNPQVRLN